MILRALNFQGYLDVSSPELLGAEEPTTSYHRTVVANQIFTVPDQYYAFPNIKNAIASGLLEVISYDSAPEGLVINAAAAASNPIIVGTITTTNATPTTIATVAISDNTVTLINASIAARRTDSTDMAGYVRRVLVSRESGGVATIVGTVDTSLTRETENLWDSSITVSGNNALIQVTGEAGCTIHWSCRYYKVNVS